MSGASDIRATTGPGQSASAHVGGVLEQTHELHTLARAHATVAEEGRGHLILISGEAGVGKTALVDSLCASHSGARILRGGCDRC